LRDAGSMAALHRHVRSGQDPYRAAQWGVREVRSTGRALEEKVR
jgi:hypothetical protein